MKIVNAGMLLAMLMGFSLSAYGSLDGLQNQLQSYFQKCEATSLQTEMYMGDPEAFKVVAHHQAQEWADTVLEGGFYSDGNTQVVDVELVSLSNQQIAYRITYREKAWNVDQCDFDYENLESLNSCPIGVIEEKSFITLDGTQALVDECHFADFISED